MLLKFGDFQIRTDSHNFTIDRCRVVAEEGENKGKAYEVPESYYPDLGSACVGLLKKRLKESDVKSVEELKELCERTVADIRAAVGSLEESPSEAAHGYDDAFETDDVGEVEDEE